MPVPKLDEIADRINKHLKRIERDPKLNPIDPIYRTHDYYCAHAWPAGNRVMVSYVTYQGSSSLTKAKALEYLVWLDAGNNGCHWSVGDEGMVDKL